MKRYRLTEHGKQTLKDISMTLGWGILTVILFVLSAIVWLMVGIFFATLGGWTY